MAHNGALLRTVANPSILRNVRWQNLWRKNSVPLAEGLITDESRGIGLLMRFSTDVFFMSV